MSASLRTADVLRIGFFSALLLGGVVLALIFIIRCLPRQPVEPVDPGTLIGKTAVEVRGVLGRPDAQWSIDYATPPNIVFLTTEDERERRRAETPTSAWEYPDFVLYFNVDDIAVRVRRKH